MQAYEVPLSKSCQKFNIQLDGTAYNLKAVWRDVAGWVLDISDSHENPLLLGVPMVPGVNLLEQYPELGINGALVVVCDKGAPEYPTENNIGVFSHLIFVQE